jgi:hypothetical protein
MIPACTMRWAAVAVGVVLAASAAYAQPSLSRAERIVIEYVPPVNTTHEPIFQMLKSHRALERVRDQLSRIRWPRTLRLELKGCNGEVNAWYSDAIIFVCYEYLEDAWRTANASGRPPAIAREDAFLGPFIFVFLHEASHALFDLLKIPVLGREEDAADQLASYYMLQQPHEAQRKLILGSAYPYASELGVRRARDLSRPRLTVYQHSAYASEHSTAAQRLYSLLCLAYGSNKKLFADVVDKGYLPTDRAEICEGEYQQVDLAYRTLIAPHVDPE